VQSAVLETIHTLYPEQYWLHIYTDGTPTENNGKGGAGAGIHCKLFSFYLTLGYHTTQFDGMLEAMNIAVRQLVSRIGSFRKAVIFSDLSAAIQSLTKVDELPSKKLKKFIHLLNS
jgi:ribonuclease HI